MKRYALIALLLAGCGPTTPSVETTALEVVIAKVTGYTKQICSFIPTDATITGIIASMGPQAESAQGIAHLICNAVAASTQPPAAGPAVFGMGEKQSNCLGMVEGVCVEGVFEPSSDAPKPME